MTDNDNTAEQTKSPQVMDVQPPRPMNNDVSPDGSANHQNPAVKASPEIGNTPNSSDLHEASQSSGRDLSGEFLVSDFADDSNVEAQDNSLPSLAATSGEVTRKHKRAPILSIVLAVLVALILGALATVLYIRQPQSTTSPASQTEDATKTEPKDKPVSSQDVDNEVKEIKNKSVDLDDSAEDSDDTLNDTTLGL